MVVNKEDFRKLADVLSDSIVVEEVNNRVGIDNIALELVNDKNFFRFGNMERNGLFWECCLLAYKDRSNVELLKDYDDGKGGFDELALFVDRFLFYFNVGRSAVKGRFLDKYVDTASSIIAYNSMIEYREAGLKGEGMIDKLKAKVRGNG